MDTGIVSELRHLKQLAKQFICQIDTLGPEERAFWLADVDGCSSVLALKMTIAQCFQNVSEPIPVELQ